MELQKRHPKTVTYKHPVTNTFKYPILVYFKYIANSSHNYYILAINGSSEQKLQRKRNYDLPGMLDEKQAAAWFGCSTRKLQRHRLDGDGPPYIKLGRLVRYLIPDLLSYAQSNRRHSTSECERRRSK